MPTCHYVRGRNAGPRRVFLAVPTYSGQVGSNFLIAYTESLQILNAAGIAVDLCIEAGNCHVDDARNSLVRQFLKTDCDEFVFLDSDIGWRGEDLLRLVQFRRDFVAGVYPCKQMDTEFPVRTEPDRALWADAEGLVEVVGVPTGFMRLSRSCIAAMVEKFGQRTYVGRGCDPDDEPYRILFERTYQNGARFSGDYAFCEKWRSIGGKIYVDPTMEFTHEGSYTWSGSLGAHWRRKHGVTAVLFQDAVKALRDGPAPHHFSWLFDGWNNPWSATPEMLAAVYSLAKKAKRVLETGSGLTTLVMALANPDAEIVCLEHDPIWAGKTEMALRDAKATNVTVLLAPLKGGWYDVEWLEGFDLVVCDGPPRANGSRELLLKRVDLKGAVVVVDDVENTQPLKQWAQGRQIEFFGESRRFAVAGV